MGLIDATIVAREDLAFVVGVDDVGIAGVGNNVDAFTAADGIPIGAIDVAVIAASADADGGVVLLRAVDAVEKIVVGSDVVGLSGGLII